MEEGGIDGREAAGSTPGSARRNSLAGMFPFLQKQQSMDTDSSDRQQRRGMGGKIKPGKQHSRSSSGDVSDSLTPGPGDVSSSAAWQAAAAHESSTTPQGWPSNSPAPSTSTSTPPRGLFSKLLSGKKKHKGSRSPTHVAVPNSPPLGSLSVGASSNGSQSPRSHSEQLPDYTMNVGGCGRSSSSSNGACLPITPPHHHRHAMDADRGGDEEGDYDSCYSTPIGSEAMLSPNQDYGGDTLDLRHMVYDAHGDKSPMPMRQDLPEVFTPGFNELLQQAGGKLQPQEPDTPPHAGALEEPTVALLTSDQLAQAGRMFDAAAMLLDPTAPQQQQQQGTAAASRSSSRCNSSMAAGSKAASRISSAVTSPEPGQPQQLAGAATDDAAAAAGIADCSELQPVCAEDIELQVAAAGVERAEAVGAVEAVAVSATAADPVRPASSASSRGGAADDSTKAVDAAGVAEDAAAAAVTAAGEAQEDRAAADAQAVQADSVPAPAAVSTEDDASPTDNEQLPTPEASEASCSNEEATAAAVEEQQEPEAVLDEAAAAAAAAPEAAKEAVSPARSSSSSPVDAEPAKDAEEAVPAADEVAVDAPEAELPVKAAAEPAADATAEPAPVALAAKRSSSPAEAPSTPAAEAGPEEGEPAMAAATADAAAPAVEPVNDAADPATAAAAVPGEVDEFALLEQQVIAEVAEEAAVDEFALLEQQVAAEEAEADEFAELERLAAAEAAAEASAGAVAAEGSSGSLGMPQVTEEPSLPSAEPSEGAEADVPANSADPTTSSPDGTSNADATGSDDSPVLGLTSTARRAARRSPMNLVRESMPLFLADPSRAMGSPLALQPGEESLDDQDMQQLSAGNAYRGSSGGGYAGTRLLSHGGAQRVSLGGSGLAGGSSFMSSLEPVEEASFTSAGSPIPEGSPSFANQQGVADSPRSDARCSSAAAAGSPGHSSPLQPRRLSSSSIADAAAAGQVTPCSVGGGPSLAMTPGSVYSTPTLAFGAAGQNLETPQSGASSAIGSAIRAAGGAGPLQLSPAMPDSMPEASPTLMLMPGQGFDSTVALQGADGSTPSLLDTRAASPSAVYATRFTATPFRGALAALPLDAALAAPLVDSSPFSLRDDCGIDTVCLADEAQRVAANLAAAAAAGGAYSPGQGATPMRVPQHGSSPGTAAAAEGRVGSPTEELRDLQLLMLTRQLAELQQKNKDLEAENAALKEQAEIHEFEKTELNSQEEMEKQARQYAEEQLQAMQVEMQQLMQSKAAQAAEMLALRQEFKGIQEQAQQEHNAMRAAHQQLVAENSKLQEERDKVLDQLNMLDMQITALKSNNNELMMAVEGGQQRCAELEALLAARDRDLAEAGRAQGEFQAKMEKMMGQVIAADTTKEHYRQKAADEAAKVQQMTAQQQQVMAERQQLLAEREKRAQDYQHLKQKYAHKSAALKECEAKLAAKDAENQELMTMCDQLLQQQEARRQ